MINYLFKYVIEIIIKLFPFLIFILFFLASCSDDGNKPVKQLHKKSLIEFNSKVINRADTSDLNIIKKKKQLRILVSNFVEKHNFLPREKLPVDHGANLVIQYAKQEGLEPVVVYAKKSLLATALLKGYGDVIASNVIDDKQLSQLSDSHAISYTQQQLIQPKNKPIGKKDKSIEIYHFKQDTFNGLRIGVQKSEVYWDTVKNIQESNPKIEKVVVSDNKTPDEILDKLVAGKYDATFSDSKQIEIALKYRQDIEVAYTMKNKQSIVWSVRKENPLLLESINLFIEKHRLINDLPGVFKGDFKQQIKKGQIRLITHNNISSYFLWKNKLMGFEYDLIKKFALTHGFSLKVLVAQDIDQMLRWLADGRGDIISASVSITPKIEQSETLKSKAYNTTQQILVQRSTDPAITTIEQLNEREIAVTKASNSWQTANLILNQSIKLRLKEIPEYIETSTILNGVSVRQFDLSIVDKHVLDIENAWRNDLQGTLVLDKEISHHWLVRKNNPKLLKALNRFIKKQHKSEFYNVTYNKYFNNSRKIFNPDYYKQFNSKKISPYDDLVKKFSKQYNFNWLLISAQINQESQFEPKAKSWAGAKGLMQMMPKTAKKLQVSNLEIPKNSISAGVKYMDWIRKQYRDELSVEDQVWFTLAAYNAGVGHVQDARKLAKKLKLNPNKWFDHTEKAMLLLSKKRYASKARYGFVRGSEPVFYVKQIKHIYQLYQKAADRNRDK